MTRQLDKFEWKKGTDAKNPEAGTSLRGYRMGPPSDMFVGQENSMNYSSIQHKPW